MDRLWRETFHRHSMLEEFQEKVKRASDIILKACKKYEKPYVAFSGGKDSTCVLHMVLQVLPDVMVLYWDYGRYYMPRFLHEEIISNAKKMDVKNLRIETSEKYEKLGRNAKNVIGEDMIVGLTDVLTEEGYDACFVGLRKEESVKRRLRITGNTFLAKIPEVYPVADFTWLDVWAYIVSKNIPYLSHYDRYAKVVGYEKVRLSTFFDPEFDKFGTSNVDGVLLWRFKNEDKRAN